NGERLEHVNAARSHLLTLQNEEDLFHIEVVKFLKNTANKLAEFADIREEEDAYVLLTEDGVIYKIFKTPDFHDYYQLYRVQIQVENNSVIYGYIKV
ncbi:hypothetical protein J9303_01815, partial [Bacillaceae bacterium Marseille-Q3522]|nr:hypothetical protein [Bacillaceae bacterium Marseille-Q3522]